ncbi:MvdC/MvdD family ATP grasp protein [Streptomyces pilosus]|uniref:MvdD-like pre-ATP grasp domain-containing protein n=1 Tax=Streptomyces pilosus TaxID=28893 RepID=A0A918F8A1_9ACTN|nr:hypothetical protein [Streptomyces pilosus]GGR09808.1 hypothetical protein GCM10010280_66910 [Streptomyces pilosus]
MPSPVLIIAACDDWPTDRIVVELERRGVEVFRMDTADFPQRLTLVGRIDRASAWTGELVTEHRTVELSRIGAVYYRAPGRSASPRGCPARRRGSLPLRPAPAWAGCCPPWNAAG